MKDFFNKDAFESEVMASVEGVYHEVNPCTIFYEASDKVGGDQMTSVAAPWSFSTATAKLDCMRFIEKLANKAFSSLCNLTGLHTNENPEGWLETGAIDAYLEAKAHETGCHIDLNHAQYAMIRRLRNIEKTVAGLLGQIAEE